MDKNVASIKARGRLLGLRVVVFDHDDAKRLYSSGFYGKPLGIPKPRGAEFEAPLELSLIEALYLSEKGLLEVVDEHDDPLTLNRLYERGRKAIPKFSLLYKVYRELRENGYVVRSGLKFGADFAVYEKGPGIEHAPYLVHVLDSAQEIDPLEIVRAGRLSHSVRKAFILALVGPGDTPTRYIVFRWSKL